MFFNRFFRPGARFGASSSNGRTAPVEGILVTSKDKFDVIRALANYNARRVKQMIVAINLLAVLSIVNNMIFDRGLWLSASAALVF